MSGFNFHSIIFHFLYGLNGILRIFYMVIKPTVFNITGGISPPSF